MYYYVSYYYVLLCIILLCIIMYHSTILSPFNTYVHYPSFCSVIINEVESQNSDILMRLAIGDRQVSGQNGLCKLQYA